MAQSKKWEEADSEFFQESYPSVDRGSTTSDLTAFLPQRTKKSSYSIIGVGTFSSTKSSSRTARIRAAIQGLDAEDSDDDLEVLDFTDENLSTEEVVWNEIQKIRDMPISLSKKKALKSQYQKCPKIKMSRPQMLYFSLRKCGGALHRLSQRLKSRFAALCSPPYHIQTSCGLDIAMTFLVLKYSLALNLLYALIIGMSIQLPYYLWSSPPSRDWLFSSQELLSVKSHNESSSWLLDDFYESARVNLKDFKLILVNSLMFYGYYDVNSMAVSSAPKYSLPVVYISTVLCVILFLSLGLLLKLAVTIKTLSYERGSDIWFKNIFGYWNYGIRRMIMVNDKQESLLNHLKFKLSKNRGYEMRFPCLGKLCLYLTRIIVCLLSVLLGFGLGWGIHSAEDAFSKEEEGFFKSLLLASIYAFLPKVLNVFRRLEKYPLNMESNIYITRLLILRLLGLYFYLSPTFERRSQYPCYENEIGLKLASVYVFEFLLKFIAVCFLHFPRVILSKYCCLSKSRLSYRPYKAEFNIQAVLSENVFDLTLCTLGLLYCPLLPLLSVTKSSLSYLLHLFHAHINCDASTRVLSPSYTLMKFTLYFFISTLSSMLGLGYVLTFIPPSKTCGPFPHQDTPLLNYVSECFSDLPFTLQRALSFLVRSDVLSLGIMMLLLINYIFYIKLKSHERMAGNLKSQLVLQGQDKKYLTSRINHLVAKSGRGSKNAKNTKKPKDQHPL